MKLHEEYTHVEAKMLLRTNNLTVEELPRGGRQNSSAHLLDHVEKYTSLPILFIDHLSPYGYVKSYILSQTLYSKKVSLKSRGYLYLKDSGSSYAQSLSAESSFQLVSNPISCYVSAFTKNAIYYRSEKINMK